MRYTAVVTLVTLIVSSVLGVCLDLVVRNSIQNGAFEDTQRVAAQWIATGAHTMPSSTRVQLVQLVDSHGRVVRASEQAAGMPPLSPVRPPADDRIKNVTECSDHHGCIMVTANRVSPQEAQQLGDSAIVYAGMAQPMLLATHVLELLAALGVLLLTAIAAWLTWCTVGMTLRPVEAIRSEMSEITGGDLSLRVPEPPGEDEIALLARTANQTLARLEAAVEEQRQFASDASHELRTPITGLRTQLEEALLYPDDVDPHDAIQAALCTTERLKAIVGDLLTLARVRGTPIPSEPIDLGELVAEETKSRIRGIPVHLVVAGCVRVRGCRIQLIRMIDNLLDNARRHAESSVEVTVAPAENDAVVTVTDDGAGIAPRDRERVFERFTRLDDGRRRDPAGSGLGLAISRNIAQAHHGTLRVEDSPRGARFTFRAPLMDTERPAERPPVRIGLTNDAS